MFFGFKLVEPDTLCLFRLFTCSLIYLVLLRDLSNASPFRQQRKRTWLDCLRFRETLEIINNHRTNLDDSMSSILCFILIAEFRFEVWHSTPCEACAAMVICFNQLTKSQSFETVKCILGQISIEVKIGLNCRRQIFDKNKFKTCNFPHFSKGLLK